MATYWNDSSLLVAPQTAFGTVNSTDGDFEAVQCEKPSVTFETAITELELLTGQIGASPERLVGRRSGKISFKVPLEGFKSGYDPTAEDPGATGVIPIWLAILGNVLGSQNGSIVSAATFFAGAGLRCTDYDAGAVASATAATITADAASDITTDADIASGCLVCTSLTPSSTAVQLGFAKSLAGAVLTLFENAGTTVNSNDADFYGSANAWLSSAVYTQVPLTMRWVGADTKFCYILQDCICESFQLTWDSGAVPTVQFNFRFYDYSMDKTKGGLVTPDAYARQPQIVGAVNGIATIGGSGACGAGLSACTLDYTVDIVEVPCHAADQGISAVSYRNPRVKVGMSVLHRDVDLVYDSTGAAGNTGSHTWQAALELGTTTSVGVYVGAKPGRCFAFLVPAGRVISVPALEDRDGDVAYKLEIEAAAYTGDSTVIGTETTANSPMDSVLRLGVA